MEDQTYLRSFTFRLLICLLVFFLAGWSLKAAAQTHDDRFLCSYYGEAIHPQIKMAQADASAHEVVEKILAVVGLKPNFELRAANVPNAAAVIVNNERYILYNPKFIRGINAASGTNWAGISIMAHEIGHHLNGHTLQKNGSRPALELESDEFSGFVLRKLGANKQQAQAAMQVAASLKSSHTHPAKRDRLFAIADGWESASANPESRTSAPTSSPVMVEIPAQNQSNSRDNIAFDVYFHDDENGTYHITDQGELVNVGRNGVYTVAKLSESNRRGYRLMLADVNRNCLYIAARGDLLDAFGNSVGYIESHH